MFGCPGYLICLFGTYHHEYKMRLSIKNSTVNSNIDCAVYGHSIYTYIYMCVYMCKLVSLLKCMLSRSQTLPENYSMLSGYQW